MNKERKSHDSASFRKLLSSHLSIYNALTNPDLDLRRTPLPKTKEIWTLPPPLDLPTFGDPYASILSWHNVSLNSESLQDIAVNLRIASPSARASNNPPSASILSSTSDDEVPSESMVVVPSLRKVTSSKVMLFETDEEDALDEDQIHDLPNKVLSELADDDGKTLTSNTSASTVKVGTPRNLHSSFIMPRMSLSDSTKVLLVILTSSSEVLKLETAGFIRFIERNAIDAKAGVHVTHLVVAKAPLKFDIALVRSSDMLFIVNDGSFVFGEFMAAVALPASESLPKLTLINIMTSNYFVNLLDIINHLRPYQIWKTPSLKDENMLYKFKRFLDEEVGSMSTFEEVQSKGHKTKKNRVKKNRNGRRAYKPATSKSMSDSLMRTGKPDYKSIERQIRSEIRMSLSYTNVDPLLLSSNLSHLRALVEFCKKFLGSSDGAPGGPRPLFLRGKFWMVLSFSVGLGLGVTFATGAVTVLSIHSYDKLKALFYFPRGAVYADPAYLEKGGHQLASSEVYDRATQLWGAYKNSITQGSSRFCDRVASTLDPPDFTNWIREYLSSLVGDLKYLATYALQSAFSGFEKAANLVISVTM